MTVTLSKTTATHPLDCILGMKVNGEVFHMSVAGMPHAIIAGETGSGKSVFVNAGIFSVMNHTTPDELEIFFIDPKIVEFAVFEGCPYCPIPPVTDMEDAYGLMKYQTWEMDNRYLRMAELSEITGLAIKNIDGYNKVVASHKEQLVGTVHEKPMKYQWIIVDEYADLYMQNSEVEDEIIRIGQKARAAGIHLWLATQRPSADIVSPNIKANIPTRMCLKVADGTNSSIIIDETGGENLRGNGDCLIKAKGESGLIRVQGTYISDPEVDAILAYLRDKYPPAEFLDYKQIGVDNGLYEWKEDYDESVKWADKRVVAKKKSGYGGW